MELSSWMYPLLFAVGLVAGLVDAIAGGGGLLALPALLSLGLPAPLALGTNKLQSGFGGLTAVWGYARGGLMRLRDCRLGVAASLAGGLAGALSVQVIDSHLLEKLIPWLLAAVVVYTVINPRVGVHEHPPRMPAPLFFALFGLGLGFYNGFLGPGTGSFWTIALVAVMGLDFRRATGVTKVMNTASLLAALALFIAAGQVDYTIGLTMGAGQIIGARLGSGLVLKKGARFVRPIFLTMAGFVMLRLLWISRPAP